MALESAQRTKCDVDDALGSGSDSCVCFAQRSAAEGS